MLTAGKKTVLNVSRVPDGTRLVVSESEWANSIYLAEGLAGQPIR